MVLPDGTELAVPSGVSVVRMPVSRAPETHRVSAFDGKMWRHLVTDSATPVSDQIRTCVAFFAAGDA